MGIFRGNSVEVIFFEFSGVGTFSPFLVHPSVWLTASITVVGEIDLIVFSEVS